MSRLTADTFKLLADKVTQIANTITQLTDIKYVIN